MVLAPAGYRINDKMNQLKSLYVLWLSGTGLLFALMLVQTLGGVYGQHLLGAWIWFAIVLLPIAILLINRYRLKELVAGNPTVYRLIFVLCILYLLAALLVILLRPLIALHTPVRLMQRAAIGLLPFQLLLFILLRNFILLEKSASQNVGEFFKKVNDRYSYRNQSASYHQVFISYSQDDEHWLDRIKTHFKPLLRKGMLDIWAHGDIAGGTERNVALENALKEANIAIVLISADFMSDDANYAQMRRLLKKAKAEESTVVIPVFANHCHIPDDSELLEFEPLNPPDEPLVDLPKGKQEAYIKELKRIVEEMIERSKEPSKNKSDI